MSRVLGLDGKSYPSNPLPSDDLDFVRGRVHYLHHDEGLSVRQIVARLEDDNNVKRSVGSVSAYLTRWLCAECSGVPE